MYIVNISDDNEFSTNFSKKLLSNSILGILFRIKTNEHVIYVHIILGKLIIHLLLLPIPILLFLTYGIYQRSVNFEMSMVSSFRPK